MKLKNLNIRNRLLRRRRGFLRPALARDLCLAVLRIPGRLPHLAPSVGPSCQNPIGSWFVHGTAERKRRHAYSSLGLARDVLPEGTRLPRKPESLESQCDSDHWR